MNMANIANRIMFNHGSLKEFVNVLTGFKKINLVGAGADRGVSWENLIVIIYTELINSFYFSLYGVDTNCEAALKTNVSERQLNVLV